MNQYYDRSTTNRSDNTSVNTNLSDKNHALLSGMNLTILTESGQMKTLWIPSSAEGRFYFRGDSPKDYEVYLELKSGKWCAICSSDTHFKLGITLYKREVTIYDGCFIPLESNGMQAVLYAESSTDNSNAFLNYRINANDRIYIGRQGQNDIVYPSGYVSKKHAVLISENESIVVEDLNSSNGTYINGHRVERAKLVCGDVVFIMGLYIVVGHGFLSINNTSKKLILNPEKLALINPKNTVGQEDLKPYLLEEVVFDRQPRKRTAIRPKPIEIEMPPLSLAKDKIPLALRMGSTLLWGGSALMTGNIIMAMTSALFPLLTQGLTEKDRKEYEARRKVVYREYLKKKELEIEEEKKREEQELLIQYPPLANILSYPLNRQHLWEHRNVDDDFLRLRIGAANIPMLAERQFMKRGFELERDELATEMYQIAERPVLLENAPATVSLMNHYSLGIIGYRHKMVPFINELLMRLILTHSYDEVKVVVLTDEQTNSLSYIKYIPHNWDDQRETRFYATNQSDALKIGEYLRREFEPLLNEADEVNWSQKKKAYVVIALNKQLFDRVEVFKDVLSKGKYCGMSILAAFDGIPKECTGIVELNHNPTLVDMADPDVEDIAFALDYYSEQEAKKSMRALMKTKLKVASKAYELPPMLTFMDLYGAGRVEHLNPIHRWKENNPVKSLAAPIGIGTSGELFTLDLHEKFHGPHGLVAGMTGSGKSEFLITYILSMAICFSPEEVAFILIDYKGGGLADAFENKDKGIHLPHLVGTITNLDGASIQRSLMSIKSELTRRQMIFKETKIRINEGTLDIYDYQKLYREGKVSEPLPHLFIISDEFAELKQQQPDFMDELISAARIGRSLGVHLILATQKPSGVVNDQIWSNSKFRACLRVQDAGDSQEMIKRPEAAELKHAGRFYLQVGYNEYFALGQSAWCGASYNPHDGTAVEKDESVQFIDNVGQVIQEVKNKTNAKKAASKQIVAIVQYLSNIVKMNPVRTRMLWTEMLPKVLDYDTYDNSSVGTAVIGAVVGMVDDPEKQRQFPLVLDFTRYHNCLMVGTAGNGKSTFLRTMLYSMVSRYAPSQFNYMILDLSNNALDAFGRMPHCGAYLGENNGSDFRRLLDRVKEEIDARKVLFTEAGVSNYSAYLETAIIPYILVIIDGYSNIDNISSGELIKNTLNTYMREGPAFGINFMLTCNNIDHINYRVGQEIEWKIAIQLAERYDYNDILNIRAEIMPPEMPGRGMCVIDGAPYTFQTGILDGKETEQARTSILKRRLEQIAQRYAGERPSVALSMPDTEQTYAEFCECFNQGRIPLGFSRQSMKEVAMPLAQFHSATLFLGNPAGVVPVFSNLLYAAHRENMELVIVKRQYQSVFDSDISPDLLYDAELIECSEEGCIRLYELLINELEERNQYRDEYCLRNGIPSTDKGRVRKAAAFIREHTRPKLVLFECFFDFISLDCLNRPAEEGESGLDDEFTIFFTRTKGYNLYFVGSYYPDDNFDNASEKVLTSFNCDNSEFILLFGGMYNTIRFSDIPFEFKEIDKIIPQYNRFAMKYRGEFYSMEMPCGKLTDENADPDLASII